MLKELLVKKRDNLELRKAQEVLRQIQEGREDFAVWGAGNTGQCAKRFFHEHSNGRLRPSCIVDNNPSLWGANNIISPEDFLSLETYPEHMIVAVYVADQIVSQLRDSGYAGKISCLNLTAAYSGEDTWSLYGKHMGELELLYEMLEDRLSKDTLVGFLNYMRSLDSAYLEAVNGNSHDKLVDALIMNPLDSECFIDVGAFTGDTIKEFLNITKGRYEKIVALEPEVHNFSALDDYVRNQGLGNVTLIQSAAGPKDCTMQFCANISESSAISEFGNAQVSVKSLDCIAEADKASWIKVSANGFELKVLKGAEQIIRQRKPKISAYASGTLLWEVPMYLKRLNPDYKIFYRHYGMGRQAMICYATSGCT